MGSAFAVADIQSFADIMPARIAANLRQVISACRWGIAVAGWRQCVSRSVTFNRTLFALQMSALKLSALRLPD